MKRKPLEIEFDGDELVAAVQNTVKLYREGRLEELRTREHKPIKPLRPAQDPGNPQEMGGQPGNLRGHSKRSEEDVYFVGERLQES
jgi:hypothetical protein